VIRMNHIKRAFGIPMSQAEKVKSKQDRKKCDMIFECAIGNQEHVYEDKKRDADKQFMFDLECNMSRNGHHHGCKYGGTYTTWFHGKVQSYYLCNKCNNFRFVKRDRICHFSNIKARCRKCTDRLIIKHIGGTDVLMCTRCMTYIVSN
jgi:hypothetical protein